MTVTHCVYVDVNGLSIEHRDFRIEESVEGWEWTHKDYRTNGITGTCDSVFDALVAVDDWHTEGHSLPTIPDPDLQRDDKQEAEHPRPDGQGL